MRLTSLFAIPRALDITLVGFKFATEPILVLIISEARCRVALAFGAGPQSICLVLHRRRGRFELVDAGQGSLNSLASQHCSEIWETHLKTALLQHDDVNCSV